MTGRTESSDLKLGSQYTISNNKRPATDVGRLSAVNDRHAELTATKSSGCLSNVIVVNLSEHDFFIANDFGRARSLQQ